MSVLYRALWRDDEQDAPGGYLDHAQLLFAEWARGRQDAAVFLEGESTVEVSGKVRTVTVRTLPRDSEAGEDSGARGVECIANDLDENGSRWVTLLRVVTDDQRTNVWVENRVESEDVTQRIRVGRPRIVDSLVAIDGSPQLGGSRLFTDVQPIPANGVSILVEHLQSPDRTLPVIVCSEPGGEHDGRWMERAEKIARRAGGIATVMTLDAAAVTEFRSELGDLAVWGGGIRIYTPSPLTDSADGWRHRYTPGRLMAEREAAMIDRAVHSVANMSTRRPVPAEFRAFTTTAPAANVPGGTPGFVSEESAELERRYWQEALDAEIEVRNQVEREYNRTVGHLQRLRTALEEQGLHELYWGNQHEERNGVPDEVQDAEDALLAARLYLTDWLEIHHDAERDLDRITDTPNANAWGNTVWRGFRALASYAESRGEDFQGGFWPWCQQGFPNAWPASSKKLSMTESETVRNNSKYKKARELPVSEKVHPSGKTFMFSHLKIAEGGGDLAPRVYFYDDTGGVTGKVHVGFVGPHYLMPNTNT